MLDWLTHASQYMPHGMCLLWQPGLISLHVVSDAAIALAYFAIPLAIAVFVSRRSDLTLLHKGLAALFAIFITACGLTHVMSIVVLWRPLYPLEGALKAVTAIASIATALYLPFLLPQLLRIPSPKLLEDEVAAHKRTLVDLEAARSALAARVKHTEDDLAVTTRRFETALKGSPISVFEQDEDLVFSWVFNPSLGLDPKDLIGRSEDKAFAYPAAGTVRALKREALASGEARRGDVEVDMGEDRRWFDLRVEPTTLPDGRPGLIATTADITRLKLNEEHLQVLTAELNHRSKNLLTIVLAIVRQTTRGLPVPASFSQQLQDRLRSLASAHDVLARQDWTGAELAEVLKGQLRHQMTTFGDRITFEGPPCVLPADATHYVGMALHELGSNAMKYGALSGDRGTVRVRWELSPADTGEDLRLSWTETGGPEIQERPATQGFGSALLQRLAPAALRGSAVLSFPRSGLVWELRANLAARSRTPAVMTRAML